MSLTLKKIVGPSLPLALQRYGNGSYNLFALEIIGETFEGEEKENKVKDM